MTNQKKIIIIGAGIGGLATAALLGKKGYAVTILEKNQRVGGRAMIYEQNGFTFDMGPSWYHMPEVFKAYFSLFNKSPEDYYKLKKLDPQYRIFFADETIITIMRDLKKNLATFETLEPGISKKILEYLHLSKHEYETVRDFVLYQDLDSFKTFLNPEIRKKLSTLKVFQSLESLTKQYVSSQKLQQILLHQGLFIGLNPKESRGFMSLFTHLDLAIGVEYPMGGITSFIESLVTLCKGNNVKILTNMDVSKIEVSKNNAQQVWVGDQKFACDMVISNADYPYTETKLLEKEWQTYPESYWAKKNIAPSAFIIYLGTKGSFKSLLHHNYYFPLDWSGHFDTIAQGKVLPYDPLIYFSCSSKTDPKVAPKGHENLFITAAIPAGIKITEEQKEQYAKHLIRKLERFTKESIEKNIVLQHIFTVSDFEKTFHAYEGTAIGLSQSVSQSMMLRPKQKSGKVKNMYYVGQYTNPGIGMPMCLISAELVVQRICNDQ